MWTYSTLSIVLLTLPIFITILRFVLVISSSVKTARKIDTSSTFCITFSIETSIDSLLFSNSLNLNNPPKIMNFNKEELVFCSKEGNVLKYMTEKCEIGNTTIRFDPIVKEIILNEPPRQITMVCK